MSALREKMRVLRRAVVLQALMDAGCVRSAAARALGVHRNTIDLIIKDCGIDVEQLEKNFASAKIIAEQKAENLTEETVVRQMPARYRLPSERSGITHKFDVEGARCYVTVNCYSDGAPGEIFLKMGKVGAVDRGWTDAWSIAFSMLLQQGTPLPALIGKFRAMQFSPAGITSSKDIPFATSVLDYVMRWMENTFVKKEKQ